MAAPDFGPKVPSPCVSVCRIEPDTNLCSGCLRTLDEIAQWPSLSDEEKDALWRTLWQRKADRRATAHREEDERD